MVFACGEGPWTQAIAERLLHVTSAFPPHVPRIALLTSPPCATNVDNGTPVALVGLNELASQVISGTVSVANYGYEKSVTLR